MHIQTPVRACLRLTAKGAFHGFPQAVQCFRAKIGFDNEGSQALFWRLGFREVGRAEVFREVTLEWSLDSDSMERMRRQWSVAKMTAYDEESPEQQIEPAKRTLA